MKFKSITAVLLLSAGICSVSYAQKNWTLKECIEYATANNITVQQTALRINEGKVNLSTAKNSRLPNLSASLVENMFFGRGPSRDGLYTDNTKSSTSFGASASVPVYEGGRIKNEIKATQLNLSALMKDYDRAKDDLSINITSFYLQVLFNKELKKVAEQQLMLSDTLVAKNQLLFEGGKVAESDVYESKALRAKDELVLTEANNTLMLSLLDLSQALNLEQAQGFDVETPQVDSLTGFFLADLRSPGDVYLYALDNRSHIQAEEFRLKYYEQKLEVAKSHFYPKISLGLGYNNAYYYSFLDGATDASFGTQMRQNGNETVGLSVSVPIFNRMETKNNVQLSKIGIRSQELKLIEAKRNLNKEIDQAYYNATAARKKYTSADVSVAAARMAFGYEMEKVQAGRSTIFDFNDSKTRLERSESEMIRAKYEFIFRKKILDFYAGFPLAQ